MKPFTRFVLLAALPAFACARVGGNGPEPGSGGGAGGSTSSGAGGLPPIGGAGGTFDSDGGLQCGLKTFQLERKEADLLLVLDRSGSMQDDNAGDTPTAASPSKWSQVVPAVTAALTETNADVAWGLKFFPEDGSACTTVTVTPRIDVQIAPMNAAAVSTAVTATTPDGDGTPTGSAVSTAVTYLQSLSDNRSKYILLATDGEPSCQNPIGSGSNTTQAHADAVTAVTAAFNAGIKTFVIGVATTKTNDAATLNQMAIAGGEAQANPNPLATKFYLATSQTELVNAIKTITGQISSCTFPLSPPPPVPDKIAVHVADGKAPQDPTHTDGWDYTDGTYTALQIYGSWCDMVKTAAANMVQIIYGCKDIIPP